MIPCKVVKIFDANDVFNACCNVCGQDIEGRFNEIYCPPQDGAVWVNLPNENESLEDYEDVEQTVFIVLHHEGNLQWGEGCYIHFSY